MSSYTISDGPTADEIIGEGISQFMTTRMNSWTARRILESTRTGDWAGAMEGSFREAFLSVVLPAIRAIDSCVTGSYALRHYLVWRQQVLIVNENEEKYFPPKFQTSLGDLLAQTATLCLERARTACYVDHQPIAVMNYALAFQRTAPVIGASDVVDLFFDLAAKCSKFKFFMVSEIWAGEDRQDSAGVTAKAEFDFYFNPFSPEPEYVCSQTFFESTPSDIRISNKEDPKVSIDVSMPMVPMGSWWGGMFTATHGPTGLNEMDLATGLFVLKGWQVRHDIRYAAKEYTHTVEGLNESTTIIIYHTPDRK